MPPMATVDNHASPFLRRERLRSRRALLSHSADRGGENPDQWFWTLRMGAACAGDEVATAGCDGIGGGERIGAELGWPDCVSPFSGRTPAWADSIRAKRFIKGRRCMARAISAARSLSDCVGSCRFASACVAIVAGFRLFAGCGWTTPFTVDSDNARKGDSPRNGADLDP